MVEKEVLEQEWREKAEKLYNRTQCSGCANGCEGHKISRINKKRITDHYEKLKGDRERRNPRSLQRHLYGLLKLLQCVSYQQDIKTFSEKQIRKAVEIVEDQTYSKKVKDEVGVKIIQVHYSEETKLHYYAVWKKYYRMLTGKKEPENVEFIRIKSKANKEPVAEEMLTKDNIEILLKSCYNIRDAALLYCLFESGGRINELLTCRKSDLKIEGKQKGKYFAKLMVHVSKTQQRPIPLVESVPYLIAYAESEYLRDKSSDAPLWQVIGNASEKARKNGLRDYNARKIINDIIKRTDINKKHNPHHWRFSRALYEKRNNFGELSIKQKFGWKFASKQLDRYIARSGEDLCNEYKKHYYGSEEEKKLDNKEPIVVRCPSCGRDQRVGALYCSGCNYSLQKGQEEVKEELEMQMLDKMFAEYVSRPEVAKRMFEAASMALLKEDYEKKTNHSK